MSNFKRAVGPSTKNNVLNSLKDTQMVETKPFLPAEILAIVLDYLQMPELLRCARTSKRMQEMVYDDSRWVQRLKSIDCWNEAEARERFEQALKRRAEAQKAKQKEDTRPDLHVNGSVKPQLSVTLFDAGLEEELQKKSTQARESLGTKGVVDGFETLTLTGSRRSNPTRDWSSSSQDSGAILTVLADVKSIRGHARQEFALVYKALAPFYYDIARSKSHTDPVIFRVYREPEQQAKMLAQLHVFAECDWAQGWRQRQEKLNSMISIFETAVVREFDQGYELWDVDGRMHKYAHVLGVLNGGQAGVDLFVQKHPLLSDRMRFDSAIECLNKAPHGAIILEPSQQFFSNLSVSVNEQAAIIERVFPPNTNAYRLLLEKIGEEIISDYVTPLFDEAHERSIKLYLTAVSGVFEQSMQYASSLRPPIGGSTDEFQHEVDDIVGRVFEPHVDLYLQEELDYFKREAEAQVETWERKLSEEDASTESFFMANVNRVADKNDFLTSFKKVVMIPVNVLPSFPIASPFAASKPATLNPPSAGSNGLSPDLVVSSRPHSPSNPGIAERSASPANPDGPTNELAAKASLMATRLEGIKSLFSIEVALNLVHSAKNSLERAAHFVTLGGQIGGEAREQCEMIFVVLLQILGTRHVKSGFDKAVVHLSQYNPREVGEHSKQGVAPLMTFLELVNVGDLISQMVDVFYDQQLAATGIADRHDFLDPAVKAKKKFEQMLDERVAAGLNKGIDVLMDEIEYVCATTQLTSDYNPPPVIAGKHQDFDIGPTKCAEQVVSIVSSHTKMLVGSTDKNMLDVFNQEVGLRLFAALCKHLKRQRISTEGAIKLISDMNLYFGYIRELRNQDLLQYYKALRELSQIYLIDPQHAKEMATIIADGDRFHGIFRAEEVYEFAERRADWFQVKRNVERAMYGIGCCAM